MEFLSGLLADPVGFLTSALTLIGAFAILARFTPTPKDDAILATVQKWLHTIINFLAQNGGHAKNKDAE